MTTRDSESNPTPREELARTGAEGYAELIELADAPDTPDHMRAKLRAIADASAVGARADIELTTQEQALGLHGDDQDHHDL